MYKSNIDLLLHIQEECEFLINHTQSVDFDMFYANLVLRKACERSIEIIGEACKKVDSDFKIVNPHVEWKLIAGTRDIIIHHYAGVDYELVWEIIMSKIPELHFQISEIINNNK